MAPPAYFITPQFSELLNVLDVQEILDDFDNTIKGAVAAWTEPGADLFRTPLDADGRFFEMQFTRISALILEFTVSDDQARSGSRTFRFDLVSGSTISFFFTGKYLYVVQFANTASFFATLLTLAPELETAHNDYTIFGSHLVTGGGSGNLTTSRWEQITTGVYADDTGAVLSNGTRTGSNQGMSRMASGAVKAYPVINVGDDGALNNVRGRLYNAVQVDGNDIPVGSEKSFPIGDGLTGVFKALNFTLSGDDNRIMIRKS